MRLTAGEDADWYDDWCPRCAGTGRVEERLEERMRHGASAGSPDSANH